MDTQQLQLFQTFEEIRQEKDGVEFWFARDLQKVLGYANWQNFQNAIGKAKESIESASGSVDYHFTDISKMVDL
jgi:DNA-damage-inducible protein D